MLTVKHVHDGREEIIAAPYGVSFWGDSSGKGEGGASLTIPKADPSEMTGNIALGVSCRALYGGMAYVMNETGATVGIYQLGDVPNHTAAAA